MKRMFLTRLALSVVAALIVMAPVAVGNGTVVLEDNFAGMPNAVPDGWEPTMDGDATVFLRSMPELEPPTGAQVVELVDESFIISPMLERDLGRPVSQGHFEFVVYNAPDNPGEIYGEVRASGAGTVIDCHISAGRILKCRNAGSLYEVVKDVQHGKWHTVRIEWDATTWTYKVYLNGEDVTPESGLRFTQEAIPTAVRFKLGSGPKVGQRAFIDSVSVVAY